MLRRMTLAALRKRFPQGNPDDIEDAVSDSLVKLFDEWFRHPSSVTDDPNKNLGGAYRYMRLEAARAFGQRVELMTTEVPFDPNPDEDAEDYDGFNPFDVTDRAAPTPEEWVEEQDLSERARAMLADLEDTEEWDDWLGDYIEGKSVRDVEAERGIPKSEVGRRRQAGMTRLREQATKYGLIEGGR